MHTLKNHSYAQVLDENCKVQTITQNGQKRGRRVRTVDYEKVWQRQLKHVHLKVFTTTSEYNNVVVVVTYMYIGTYQ